MQVVRHGESRGKALVWVHGAKLPEAVGLYVISLAHDFRPPWISGWARAQISPVVNPALSFLGTHLIEGVHLSENVMMFQKSKL